MTDSVLEKAIKARCKECNSEKDLELCKGCKLKGNNKSLSILKYCKECLNGNDLEYCGCEETCALYKYIPKLKAEIVEKLKKK